MKLYKKSIIIVILMLIISSTTISNILAASEIDVKKWSIPKGSGREDQFFIYNNYDIDLIYDLDVIGDIKEWVVFYKLGNRVTPINSILVNKYDDEAIIYTLEVPEDAVNGIYSGAIRYVPRITDENETGVQVILSYEIKIQIEVTGEQIIDISVERIRVKDAEIGFPAVNEIDCKNNGNVKVTPKIDIEFSIENIFVQNITKSGRALDPISPGQTKTYTIYWDTSQLVRYGNYTAFFNITLGNDIIKQESKDFKIIKQGTLERIGRLDDLKFKQEPKKGTETVLTATFTNIGQIDIFAQFNATIYLNGKPLQNFTSQKVRVPIYSIANFESNIPIAEDGQYEVKGHVYYHDTQNIITKETEEIKLTFTILATSSLAIDPAILILAMIIVIIVLVLLIFLSKHKKRSPRNKDIKKSAEKELAKPSVVKTSKRRIRIARNKEKSPFRSIRRAKNKEQATVKSQQTDDTKRNEIIKIIDKRLK